MSVHVPNNSPTAVKVYYPDGYVFSSVFTSDGSIATCNFDATVKKVIVNPNPEVTGIVYVTVFAVDANGNEITGCIDLHCVQPSDVGNNFDSLILTA